MKEWKSNYITAFVKKVRDFNVKHKAVSPITIFFTLLWVFLVSFTIGIFDLVVRRRKIVIPIAALLIIAIIVVTQNSSVHQALDNNMGSTDARESAEVNFEAVDTQSADVLIDGVSTDELTDISAEANAENAVAKDTEEASQEATAEVTASEEASSEEMILEEASADTTASEETDAETSTEEAAADVSTDGEISEESFADAPDESFQKVSAKYPEAVAWLYFEDGSVSYPIMQSDDNTKYLTMGYNGEEAWEGAIFLDYRSASDFSDSNSIVYGHNMKDGTMFGSFKNYKFDSDFPKYYEGHKYFRIITPDETYRYQIFAFMDISKDNDIFEFIGDKSSELLKNIDGIRKRSYINSDDMDINESSNIVTLSTCTKKDQSSFVMCGVRVE